MDRAAAAAWDVDEMRADPFTIRDRLAGRLRGFGRCRRGATAVEFAMIAVPFLATLFAVLETGLKFWSAQVLETAVTTAARQIYTGQFQTNSAYASMTSAQKLAKFKTIVCANVYGLFNCASMVSVDVQRFADGTTPSVPRPVDASGAYSTSSYGWNPPGAGEIGVVRASMVYPNLVPLNPNGTIRGGKLLIMGSATFRVEPYGG